MFDPADRRKQILYKAVAALARRERSRLGLYKKLSETFNEEGDKELINSVLDELVNKKYLSDERYARIQVLTRSARYGDRKLFWNLQRDGVSREIAEEALKQNEESRNTTEHSCFGNENSGCRPGTTKNALNKSASLRVGGLPLKLLKKS